MRKLLAIAGISAFCQLASGAEVKDPFDLSATQSKVRELGVPTVAQVLAIETQANELYRSGDCKAAAPALAEYARKVNWLANIVGKTVQPVYGTPGDVLRSLAKPSIKDLQALESTANALKARRNTAFVHQADCLLKLGNKEAALPLLLQSLEAISATEPETWDMAIRLIKSIVELK